MRILVLPFLRLNSDIDDGALIEPQLGLIIPPDPRLLLRIIFSTLEEHASGNNDVLEELGAHIQSSRRAFLDDGGDDFSLERAEDDHAELDVDVEIAGAVADETVGCFEDVVHADAEADFLDDFVGVFLVDFVFDLIAVFFVEVVWRDLD